jgi:hypothetical protein
VPRRSTIKSSAFVARPRINRFWCNSAYLPTLRRSRPRPSYGFQFGITELRRTEERLVRADVRKRPTPRGRGVRVHGGVRTATAAPSQHWDSGHPRRTCRADGLFRGALGRSSGSRRLIVSMSAPSIDPSVAQIAETAGGSQTVVVVRAVDELRHQLHDRGKQVIGWIPRGIPPASTFRLISSWVRYAAIADFPKPAESPMIPYWLWRICRPRS